MSGFNVVEQTQNCIDWIRNWFSLNGDENTKAVIGISGGKDSSVVAALCVEALGKDRVIGVQMPNGVQSDIADSDAVIKHLGIKSYCINICNAYSGLTEQMRVVSENGKEFPTYQYKTNTPARLRMVTLYGVAATIGNCRVANTCNLSEDMVGFSTFYGDSAGDFAPISKLTTEEVIAIGDYLELPKELVHKTPSDGMCGSSDEDKLGFTYHEVNEFIRAEVKGEHFDKIKKLHDQQIYKIRIIQIPYFDPELPNYFKKINFGL